MSPATSTALPLQEPSPSDPLVGCVLAGTYVLGDVMARGGMGILYAAEHTRLGTPLVVKVLRERYASHPVARTRFEREARATASLSANHVLRVIDLVTTPDGRPAVVTERLVGEDLQQHLSRRKALALPLALDITRQVLKGLLAAHAAGVVHRDIKPSNIFLSPGERSPHVRVLDFGVAKLVDAAGITKAGAVVGTPAYMPPEQAAGRPVDARGDVYSAGAVLYRMLAGRPPFSGDADSVLRAVLGGPAPALSKLVPSLPEPVCEVVERAMRRDPADRYASAGEMLQAVDALAAVSTTPSVTVHALGGYQRARLEGALVLAALLGFAGVVGYTTLAQDAALRVPLALLYGSLSAAWGAALRHAYRRCAESKSALDEWSTERFTALVRGLALLGALSLAGRLGAHLPAGAEALALLPLVLTETRSWRRARALA